MTMGDLLQGSRTEFFKSTVLKICRTFFYPHNIGRSDWPGMGIKGYITITILSNVYVIKKKNLSQEQNFILHLSINYFYAILLL